MAKDILAASTPKPLSALSMDEIEAKLKLLELQEKQEIRDQKDENKRTQLAHRKMNALNEAQKQKNMEAMQRGCTHQKKNGETYLAGQRDHSNNLHLICQGCMKHFYGPEVPSHLRPEAERVGGPEITSTPFERQQELYSSNPGGKTGATLDVPMAVAAMGE